MDSTATAAPRHGAVEFQLAEGGGVGVHTSAQGLAQRVVAGVERRGPDDLGNGRRSDFGLAVSAADADTHNPLETSGFDLPLVVLHDGRARDRWIAPPSYWSKMLLLAWARLLVSKAVTSAVRRHTG